MIPVADDLPLPSEDAIDGERQSNWQPVHATAGAARLIPLDDEVPVVLLDREAKYAEAIDRGPARWRVGVLRRPVASEAKVVPVSPGTPNASLLQPPPPPPPPSPPSARVAAGCAARPLDSNSNGQPAWVWVRKT